MGRYWFLFDLTDYNDPPPGIIIGCGITEASFELAMSGLKKVFDNRIVPPILNCIEDIDISTLDADHVRPNMGSPSNRGIWFPLGY